MSNVRFRGLRGTRVWMGSGWVNALRLEIGQLPVCRQPALVLCEVIAIFLPFANALMKPILSRTPWVEADRKPNIAALAPINTICARNA